MNIELKVGDLTYRCRIISDLLHSDTKEVEYGPLSLRKEGETIQCKDFDGRVYPEIEIPQESSQEDAVLEVVEEVDRLVEQVFEEL